MAFCANCDEKLPDGIFTLADLLKLNSTDSARAKIRLISNNGESWNTLEEFNNNFLEFKKSVLHRNGSNITFKKGQLAIGLLQLGNNSDKWLFITAFELLDDVPENDDKIEKFSREVKKFEHFSGRLILKYKRGPREIFGNYNKLSVKMEVNQYLPSFYDADEFNGYDNVCLTYNQLKSIQENNKIVWINALKSQQAVYVITDTKTGKLYIGSATSKTEMLWQRWTDYIKNGHGGDVELKEIVKKNSIKYVEDNFQYSILENFNSNVECEYVLKRESYWKKVFDSYKHGYNKNL